MIYCNMIFLQSVKSSKLSIWKIKVIDFSSLRRCIIWAATSTTVFIWLEVVFFVFFCFLKPFCYSGSMKSHWQWKHKCLLVYMSEMSWKCAILLAFMTLYLFSWKEIIGTCIKLLLDESVLENPLHTQCHGWAMRSWLTAYILCNIILWCNN